MNKRILNREQIKILQQNSNVDRCGEKSITYNKEFKLKAVNQYLKLGLSPNEIFSKAGFNMEVIGKDTPKLCLHRWRKILNKKGIKVLTTETRGKGGGGGRPKKNWQDEKEKIKYLEAKVAYLEAKNDFLAKLRKKR